MKRVVTQRHTISSMEASESNGIVAYKYKQKHAESATWWVLTKINAESDPSRYGFVNTGDTDGTYSPAFIDKYPSECIERAMDTGMEVVVFDDYREFVNYVYNDLTMRG